MKRSKTIVIVSIFSLILFTNCISTETRPDNLVECRLFWIGDSYPKDIGSVGEDDFRMIQLHYIVINKTKKDLFLPIKKSMSHDNIDTAYCSKIIATINKKPIDIWFSADTRWRGVLKPNDSIRVDIKIPEGRMERANVNKYIQIEDLLKGLETNYIRCLSDTIFSTHPIPQLRFTINDKIAIHYKDTIIRKQSIEITEKK